MTSISNNINKKLENNGYLIVDFLGSGTRGEAYKLTNNNALKVTIDRTEALAMNHVLHYQERYDLKNIVKIYAVWQYKSLPYDYFIEQELLNDIPEKLIIESQKDEGVKNNGQGFYGVIYDMFNREKDFFDLKQEFPNILKLIYKNAKSSMAKKFVQDMINAKEELKKLKIQYHDFCWGNVMVDNNNNFKLIDLGYSVAPQDKIDDIRESKSILLKEQKFSNRKKFWINPKGEIKEILWNETHNNSLLNLDFNFNADVDSYNKLAFKAIDEGWVRGIFNHSFDLNFHFNFSKLNRRIIKKMIEIVADNEGNIDTIYCRFEDKEPTAFNLKNQECSFNVKQFLEKFKKYAK